MTRAPRSTWASTLRVPETRPGTVISAPCSTTRVRVVESGPEEAERQGRVEDDELGADLVGERVDLATQDGVRQQHRLLAAHDPEGLLGIPGGGAVVRRGEDGDLVGGQPAPQLPQVGLDAAELRREVVGDEQVPHGGCGSGSSARRRGAASSARTSGSGSSATTSSRSSRPRRRAAHAAWLAQQRIGSVRNRRRAPTTAGSSPSPMLPEDQQGVAAQVARIPVGDVPAAVAVEQVVVVGVEQLEHRDPGAVGVARGPRLGRPGSRRRFGGHTSWQSSQP